MAKVLARWAAFAAVLLCASAAFGQVDLSISSVSASPSAVTLGTGDNVSYFVNTFNGSSSTAATNVTLTANLPASSTFVSATASGGGSCSQNAGVVTCTWATQGASASFSTTIVVTPGAAGTNTLTASLTANESDPNTANNNGSASATVNSQIDLSATVSSSPSAVTLGTGDTISYFVNLFNASSSKATNATLTANLPASSAFVSATASGGGSCGESTGVVTCTWATYNASNSFSVTIVVTPGAAGANTLSASIAADQGDPNTSNNSGSATTTVNSTINLSLNASSSPSAVTLGTGDTVSYFLNTFNASSSKATNATVTANLPASSAFVSATATGGGSCGQSAGVVTCTWATYNASNSLSITIVVTPGAAGANTLSASISADQGDPDITNNSASATTTVNATIDLSANVSSSPSAVTLGTGDNVSYFVNLFNASSSKATNATLTANLPASSTFVSATATGGGSCSQSAGVVTCTWATYNSSNSFSVTIVVTPGAAGANTLTASIAADQGDPNTSNNSGTATTTVNATIDLSANVSSSPSAVTLGTGDNVSYFVNLFNASSSKATNATLTANLPASSTFVSATATGSGSCSQSAGVVTCTWATYNSSNSFSVTIVVTPGASGANTLTASIAADQGDPNTSNNSGTATTTVNATIDLSANVSSSPSTISLGGGNVSYFVNLFNASSSKATNATLTANLPASSTYVSATASGGGTCSQSAGVVTCSWATYNSSNSFSVTIVVTPGAAGANTLSASIAADQGDPNTSNNSGTATTTVNPTSAPVITTFSPTSGPATASVTLTGSNFTGTTSVKFNGTSASFTVNGDTQVTTAVPAGATSGTISATNAIGTGTSATSFTVNSAPTVSSFSPSAAGVGVNITITGSAFTGATAVAFNGTSASYTVNSDTQIVATVPSGATTGPITVTNAIGVGTSASSFTVSAPATITAIASGLWGSGSTWSGGVPPGSLDTAVVNGFAVTVASSATVANLTLGGNGTINGFGGLTVTGTMNWTSNSSMNGVLVIPSGAQLNISGGGTVFIDGGTLHNAGTVNWGNADISYYDNALIDNQSGGLFVAAGDNLLYNHCNCTAPQTISNVGTFRKLGTSGTTQIAMPFSSSSVGSVDLQSGTTVFTNATISTGINVASGATLSVPAGTGLAVNSTATLGNGTLSVSGGTLSVGGALSVQNMTLSSGTVTGSGDLSTTSTGTILWNGDSTMTGAGTTTIPAGGQLSISGSGTRVVDGRTIHNAGTISWGGSANLSAFNSALIDNQTGGLIDITGDATWFNHCNCGAPQTATNNGTIRKSAGSGTTTIVNALTSSAGGSVDIQSGTLVFRNASISSPVSESGSGTLAVDASAGLNLNGNTQTGANGIVQTGGTLTITGNVVVANYAISGGTLTGSGDLRPSSGGAITWSADSTWTGSGSVTIPSGTSMTINGSGTRLLDGRTIHNAGTIHWGGTANLSAYNSALVDNQAGALIDITGDALWYNSCNCTAAQTTANNGTIRKSAGSGTTIVSNALTSAAGASVDIQSGTLIFRNATISSPVSESGTGTLALDTQTALTLNGVTQTGANGVVQNGGTLTVTGNVVVANYAVSTGTLTGAGDLQPSSGGAIGWNGDSSWTGGGTVTIPSGTSLNITGSGTRILDNRTIHNAGTINWGGSANFSVYDASLVDNQAGALIDITGDALWYNHCNCTPPQTTSNAGTLRKSAGSGTTTIVNALSSSGAIEIQSGTLLLRNATVSSTIAESAGTTLALDGSSSVTLSGAAETGGNGIVQTGGTLITTGTNTVDGYSFSGGTLTGSGTLQLNSGAALNWTSDSTMTGGGTVTIPSGAAFNVSGAGTRYLDNRVVHNAGAFNWSGANISEYDNSLLDNQAGGVFTITGDNLFYNHCNCTAAQTTTNAGTFRKTTAGGTTSWQLPLSNSGAMDFESGTVAFSGGVALTGGTTFGIGSATTYGRVTSAGAITLGGALTANAVNGFVPQGGQQYDVIQGASLTGSFNPKTLTFGTGRSFADSYTSTTATLTASGPTISTLSPNHGTTGGGTAVAINGNGFAAGGSFSVTFGGTAATCSVAGATLINCTTPSHPAGAVDVVVTNGDGQPTTAASAYTFDTTPTFSFARPTTGGAAGGGSVVIGGTNLGALTGVTFGGVAGTIVYSSATEITVAAPAHAAGTVDITLTDSSGSVTATNAFTFIADDDPARDFSVLVNPAPRWSYGSEPSRGAAFTLFTGPGRSAAGMDSWPYNTLPIVQHNPTAGTVQQASNFTPPGGMIMHPGAGGENAVVRWTAPSNGSYRISGHFTGLDATYPTTTDVAILLDNNASTPIFTGYIASYNIPLPFSADVTVTAGETIEFTVGFGGNGYSGDATGLDAVILPLTGPAVTVTSVAPSSGISGTNVTVGGTNFHSGAAVTFGDVAATNVVVVDPSTITCTVPSHAAGAVDVVVTHPDSAAAALANGFTYTAPTVDLGVTPNVTPSSTTVGSNFSFTTTVKNNGNSGATNVSLTQNVPSNLTLSSSVTPTQGTCSGTTSIACSLGALAAGAQATVTFTATANAGGTAVTTATATESETDANGADNTATASAAVTGTSSAVVTTNADSGTGSLRQAILDANSGVCTQPCTISFNVPAGNETIAIGNAMSALTALGTTIDGTTQPTYPGARITLDGANAAQAIPLLQLLGTGDTVRGLALVRGPVEGLRLGGSGGHTVAGNYIGTQNGSTAAGNDDGIVVGSSNNAIGGSTAADRNVISGNNGSGVVLKGVSGNAVTGNTIGLDASGTAALGNNLDGVQILLGASSNAVTSNVISGNTNSGVYVVGAPGTSTSNVISGNTIGTDAAGTSAVPNNWGVYVSTNSVSTIVGGFSAASANLISGNNLAGVFLTFGSTNTGVYGNRIGTNAAGTAGIPNGVGVEVSGAGSGTAIGSPLTGGANTIAYNGRGVGVSGSTGAVIAANSIHDNTNLGIDLGDDGPTANDAGDADSGANGLQNHPDITDASMSGSTLTVSINVDSSAVASTQSIGVELFKADTAGTQGKTSLGTRCFTGNLVSNGSISIANSPAVLGDTIVATATSYADSGCTVANDGTSEFSAGAVVGNCVPPSASVTASGPTTFCAPGSVTLTAAAGAANYLWSNGATTQAITVSAGGTFTVTVTSATGCSATSSPVTVTVKPVPSVTISAAGPTSFCNGGSVALNASASGGSGNVASYQWYRNNTPLSGATAASYNATASGSYTATATDANGCTSAASNAVSVSVTATASPTITAGGPTTFCQGGSVTLTASAASSWLWSNGATTQSIAATSTGNYSVTTTDANGCTATSAPIAVTVNPLPNAAITAPPSMCANTSAGASVASSAGATYTWTAANATINSGDGTPSINFTVFNSNATLNVAITDVNGCTSSGTATISVGAFTPAITASGPATFCQGGSVTLTATTGTSYLWSTGAHTQSITVSATGSYSVTVNNGSCSGTSAPFNVTVNPIPSATITANGPTTFCTPNSVTLTASPAGASYLWSNGATSQSIVASASGSYSVTVTANGCSATSAPVAVTANPGPSIAAPPSVCPNSTGNTASVTAIAGATYAWSISGGTITSAANGSAVTFTAGAGGTAVLTVAVGNISCSGTLSANVAIQPATVTISGPSTACPNASFTLDAGSGFTTYAWSNGATTQTITVSQTQTTTYSVTVTTPAGCSATGSKTVAAGGGSVAVSAPQSVAANTAGHTASVPAGPAGTAYNWTVSNGTLTAGQGTSSITFSAGATGPIALGVTVNTSGCTATGSASVAVNGVADLAVAVTAPPTAAANAPLAYNVAVQNLGPNSAQNVSVTALLGQGVAFTSAAGTGWSCSANGTVVVCTAPSVPVGTATPIAINATTPSSGGTVAVNVSVSSNTFDPKSSNNSATASTNVTGSTPQCPSAPPSLLGPANNAANVANPVTFSWTAVQNATAYDLFVNGSVVATTPSTTATTGLPAGPATWSVVARSGNCAPLASETRSFTVAAAANCGSHAAPQLAGATQNANDVTFQWSAAAEAVGYRLWIAVDGGAAQDAGTTNGALTLTIPIDGTNVVWFVEALFNGCPPAKSSTAALGLAKSDPCAGRTAPSPVAPANNATSSTSSIDFRWSPAAGAAAYRLFAAVDGAPFALLGTTADPGLAAVLPSGSVEWYVEALFDGCAALDSAHAAFTIPRKQNCPTAGAAPQSPVNVTLDHSPVTFVWNAVPNAIGYDVWLSLNHAAPSLIGSTGPLVPSLLRAVGSGEGEWYVVTRFDGCPSVESAHASFTLAPDPNCPTKAALLVEPADDAAVDGHVTFRWSAVPGAAQYVLYLGVNDAPPIPVAATSGLHIDQNLGDNVWTWFVAAQFPNGCSSTESAHGRFTVLPAPQPCATPATPVVRASTNASANVNYAIRWNAIGNAAFYEVQQSTSPDFANATVDAVYGTEKSYQHANAASAPLLYYYRVRAVGACDATVKSLYSPVLVVAILPPQQTANGATPADDPQPVSYTLNVPATPGLSFSATSNQPWITITPSTGTTTSNNLALTVTANTTGLPVGTSTAAVSVQFGSPSRIGATATSTSTTVNVNLTQPVSPGSKNTPPPDALIIPAVAHAGGINSNFQSDVRITNTAPQTQKYQLTFTPDDNSGAKSTTIAIDPGKTLALDDILATWFGNGTGVIGTLEIRPTSTTSTSPTATPSVTTFASSRTYNLTANGTFGQYIPAIPFSQFISKNGLISLQQIASSSAFRTNLGLVEASGDPASVLVSVFGSNGSKLTEFTQALNGGQHLQLNGILATKGITDLADGRIEVKLTSNGGKVTAYASVLDNQTNDPLLVPPLSISTTGAPKYVLPGIADLNNGIANWRSDVRIYNPSAKDVTATATFYPLNAGDPVSKQITLAANQVQELDAALQTLFNLTNTGGALHITTDNSAPLVITARTYNQTTNGTFGQFIPAVTANDAVGKGGRALQILQVEESDRFRSNIGVTEVTGKPAKVEITAIPPDSKFAVTGTFDFGPNEYRQYSSLLKSMGLDTAYNTRVTVRVIDGDGKVTAYASVVDMQTQDPNYVQAQ